MSKFSGSRGASTGRASRGSRDRNSSPLRESLSQNDVGDRNDYHRYTKAKAWQRARTRGRRCNLSAERNTKEIRSKGKIYRGMQGFLTDSNTNSSKNNSSRGWSGNMESRVQEGKSGCQRGRKNGPGGWMGGRSADLPDAVRRRVVVYTRGSERKRGRRRHRKESSWATGAGGRRRRKVQLDGELGGGTGGQGSRRRKVL